MSSFTWDVDGEMVDVVFSLIRNGRWLNDNKDAVCFDYLDNEDMCVMAADLDLEGNENDLAAWNMLLQVTNLDAT